MALGVENVLAISYFLDRKELLLESSLRLFELLNFKITGGEALESMRNPKTIILSLTMFATSSKIKQHLLHHSSLNDTYSRGLLNVHLNEIFTLIFPGPKTKARRWDLPPRSRFSAILLEYNEGDSVDLRGRLLFTQMYRVLVHDVLRYGPVSDPTHLDQCLVGFLESGNVIAARKLVEYGAQLTLQAENIRGDLVLEKYQLMSWRHIIQAMFAASSKVYSPKLLKAMTELLWDINWVFGGRFDLSWLDQKFNKKVDNMSFWNTGQKSIEVNEWLDKIDNEQGWPIYVEFRV
jgi:hypothetical protein